MNKSIAVAGTGYVGLSISVLLAQHNHVVAVDIIPEKIALINQKKSPIQDEYIKKQYSLKYYLIHILIRQWQLRSGKTHACLMQP